MSGFITYIEDVLLARIQRRCEHPSPMVASDILEGCVYGIEIRYCRRCGAVKTVWSPPHGSRPSWRSPSPHLWRDPVAWRLALKRRLLAAVGR